MLSVFLRFMEEKSFLVKFGKYLLQFIAENYPNIGYNVLIWLFLSILVRPKVTTVKGAYGTNMISS
jgi:hypothetical protein